MTLEKFNQDLFEAQNTNIDKVSNIIRGDDSDTIKFTYHHDSLAEPAVIQMIFHDCTQYPKNVDFIAFSEFDSTHTHLTRCLDRAWNTYKYKNISEAIHTISDVVTATVEARDQPPCNNDDDDDDDKMSWQGTECVELDPLEPHTSSINVSSMPNDDSLSFLWEAPASTALLHSLRRAQSMGIIVGIYPRPGTHIPQVISLSTKAASLGVAAGVMETWGLRQADNLVLLIRVVTSYPSLPEFVRNSGRQKNLHFRFGKCRGEKPSSASVQAAFQDTIKFEYDYVKQIDQQDTQQPFELINMSITIESLLNINFPMLLGIKRDHRVSWEGAQFISSQRSLTSAERHNDAGQANANDSRQIDTATPLQDLSGPLSQDAALDAPESFSLPLVAMQLALHRLANCTSYCMVCNARLPQELHSLKPHVCCKPLCLFQYQSLGLGSSIEHDIINAPYVVDMLVSFLYVALVSGTVRQLPTGLHIKTAYIDKEWARQSHATALADLNARKLKNVKLWAKTKKKHKCADRSSRALGEGDRILIVERQCSSGLVQLTKYWCRLTSKTNDCWSFDIFNSIVVGGADVEEKAPASDKQLAESWKLVHFFGYWKNIDDLSIDSQCQALLTILDGLPSVLEMRQYLMDQPGRRLATWSRVNKYELSVLNWTVASNRSLIVQDEAVPSHPSASEEEKTWPWNKINFCDTSSENPWMQFRFLQGSPEREEQFERTVESMSRMGKTPTIFAWHGSLLKNWHSIIRTGLDFNDTQNGRAYGNGVYFSNCKETSLGYSGGNPITSAGYHWSKSELNITTAIAICELIKKPREFVSTTPHYVVDKLDWIQCRYLLVKVQPSTGAISFPFYEASQNEEPGYVIQDYRYQIIQGTGEAVKIPVTALPRHRRAARMAQVPKTAKNLAEGANTAPSAENTRQFSYDADDVEFYLGAREADIQGLRATDIQQRKRNGPSDCDDPRRDLFMEELKGTDFDPTKLDMNSLRLLQSPAWASASPQAVRRLAVDLKDLSKRQKDPQNDYSWGYHVHTDRSDNMFQWIVELFDFDETLPLSQDMEKFGCGSIVIELLFGPNYPMSPPFVRAIRPQLVPFAQGGGGHVTVGGAFCLELLTNSGWTPAMNIDNIIMEIRAALSEKDRPARVDGNRLGFDYSMGDAVRAFIRLANTHGWAVPEDFRSIAQLV